jgi:DNA-binding MarR family transcriptional regulator
MVRFPGYLLRRASAAAMAKLTADLAVLSVRPTEASVLLVVDANPGITQSEIGKLLDIARANMAPLASRLHKRHLMARARIDGRSQGLRLTEAGRGLVSRIEKIVTAYEAELLQRIPSGHRAGFIAGLRALWGLAATPN